MGIIGDVSEFNEGDSGLDSGNSIKVGGNFDDNQKVGQCFPVVVVQNLSEIMEYDCK